jgi:hypothetical protein
VTRAVFKIFKSDAPGEAAAPATAGAPARDGGHAKGCVVCGKDLAYLAASERMACALCGAAQHSAVRCKAGHFVCDPCHSGAAKDLIEKACAATEERDPIALALRLMRSPALRLHGPEHHFLVPAVLLATFSNVRGEGAKRAERVAEARRRSEPVLGGFCGLQGACGAAIGTGTFVALATASTPLRGKERGLSNRMTAQALSVVGRMDAARCCKRDSLLSILAAAKFAREHLQVSLPASGPACEWSNVNGECAGGSCPFNR